VGNSGVSVAVLSWPKAKTFLGGYLPVVVAKLYQMAWTAFHNDAQQMAPFTHLSSPNGAPGSALFGSPDLLSWVTLVPVAASWLMIPFAADSIYFDTNYECPNPDPTNPNNPCWPPKMTSNPWVIRTLQAFLSVTALVSVALIAAWFKKPHGGSNDPTSIAAVAAITGHPEVLRDFACAAEMSTKDLKRALKGKKYKLGEYQNAQGTTRYGMIPAEEHESAHNLSSDQATTVSKRSRFGVGMGWKEFSLYADGIFVCYIIGLLAIVAVYLRDVDKSSLAKLFSGSSVGRRIVFALIGAIAAMNFSRIERGKSYDLRILI
jgi:hypothetical protein